MISRIWIQKSADLPHFDMRRRTRCFGVPASASAARKTSVHKTMPVPTWVTSCRVVPTSWPAIRRQTTCVLCCPGRASRGAAWPQPGQAESTRSAVGWVGALALAIGQLPHVCCSHPARSVRMRGLISKRGNHRTRQLPLRLSLLRRRRLRQGEKSHWVALRREQLFALTPSVFRE